MVYIFDKIKDLRDTVDNIFRYDFQVICASLQVNLK